MRAAARIATLAAALLASAAVAGGGVSPATAPAGSAALVEFGRRMFFSVRLSSDGSVSCASCHQPDHAFADARPVSSGAGGRAGVRNAPSLLDVGERRRLFWDGRADALPEQALQPLLNADEQGFHDVAELARRLGEDDDLLPPAIRRRSVQRRTAYAMSALAAFERTLHSRDLPVDRLLRDPDDASVAPEVRRGFDVFRGVGQCAQCHRVGSVRAALTDESFHLSAKGVSEEALTRLPRSLEKIRAAKRSGPPGALGQMLSEDADVAALGRFVVTGKAADVGAFKTPGLRSVALTAPYMHDGSVGSLEEAMDLELYRIGEGMRRPVPLGEQDRRDLLAFLNSLAARQ